MFYFHVIALFTPWNFYCQQHPIKKQIWEREMVMDKNSELIPICGVNYGFSLHFKTKWYIWWWKEQVLVTWGGKNRKTF